MTLNHLSHAQVEQIVNCMTDGKTFPAEVLQQIITKTDGVPLFVEEVTKAILESGQLKARDGHYELTGSLSTFAIPATLQDSLMARLDRLVTAKGIAQIGATIGRQFSYGLLQIVSQVADLTLQRELGRLVEAELLYQRGLPPQATYTFKHALIQDAAYESLLRSTRQHHHQRIAQVLEEQFTETAEAEPELLAHHYTEAGLPAHAVAYWSKAAQRAVERSAHVEAITHLRQGLALLQTLPETPERTQREVDILIALGASLLATQGYAAPEVRETYTRARQLCEHLENPYQLFPILRGLWNYYQGRAEYHMARTLGEPAHTHFAQGIALYDLQQHRASTFLYGEDAGVVCHTLDAVTLWLLGYPDQGRAQSQKALALAQQIAHPLSLSFALGNTATFHQLRREVRAAHACTEAAMRISPEQQSPQWQAMGALLHGWILVQQGQAQEGSEQLTQGLTAWRASGAEIARPYWLMRIAEAHGRLGAPAAGLTVLTEALALVDTTGERLYESELYRCKGVLLLQKSSDNQAEAEDCFQHALEIARSQQAKSWELRAATSLARLWQQQGKRQEAHDLLAPVYNWFTEGFDTADLKDAKALLDELA
jgi:predicted ATPase